AKSPRFYRIGTTYGDDSMACMTLFHNATQRSRDAQNGLRYIAATTPKLPSICSNEDVLQALYDYNSKHHPYMLGTVITKRSLLEPPIPGWTGFVPRARVTELGYGVPYHEMTKNCYQDFKNLRDQASKLDQLRTKWSSEFQRFRTVMENSLPAPPLLSLVPMRHRQPPLTATTAVFHGTSGIKQWTFVSCR
uniref:Sperm-associated microtubule inner protein 5 domain-containing protein n=1 Tax=Chrysemys picta bellii TaxID=8478 RepID=A0A8C3H7V0_CHRPI